MSDERAPYAAAVERLANAISSNEDRRHEDFEKLSAELLALRSRVHEVHGAIQSSERLLERINVTMDVLNKSGADHETRIRRLEALSPEALINDNEREHRTFDSRLSAIEKGIQRINVRLAYWAGGGAVLGAIAAQAVPKIFH